MFKHVNQVVKEQFNFRDLIVRMALFENKGNYQIHYLGTLWYVIHPAIQVAIYWFVFGTIRSGGTVNGTPFFLWLIIGLVPWFFISPSIIQGSNSVHQKANLVSQMSFPMSVLPSIRIIGNSIAFFVMMGLLIVIALFYGIVPTIYFGQLIYYIFCLYIFLFAFTILSSTISTLIRDFQVALQSFMRMLLYVSPILWDMSLIVSKFGETGMFIQRILQLNPLFYIIEGFRDALLGRAWFYEDIIYMGYFWSVTFFLLFIGANLHMAFRDRLIDYL